MIPDYLSADDFSALGAYPVLIVDAADWVPPRAPVQAVVIGVDRNGALPDCEFDAFDVLLTTDPDAPAPWVAIAPERLDAHVALLEAAVRATPIAATILCQTLRLTPQLRLAEALTVESFAYSALLSGIEFAQWRARTDIAPDPELPPCEHVDVARIDDHVILTLNTPDNRNAMTAAMRDALYGALANVLDDPSEPTVSLRGAGKCFSTGGHLPEFGTTTDGAQTHIIRTLHSCAALIDVLDARCDVHFHGAVVGSGLEVGMAAARRTADANTFFQLPELHMGLIPGAGGTATVARAIGRHRTTWMVLTGKRINAQQALAWGLVHEIVAQ